MLLDDDARPRRFRRVQHLRARPRGSWCRSSCSPGSTTASRWSVLPGRRHRLHLPADQLTLLRFHPYVLRRRRSCSEPSATRSLQRPAHRPAGQLGVVRERGAVPAFGSAVLPPVRAAGRDLRRLHGGPVAQCPWVPTGPMGQAWLKAAAKGVGYQLTYRVVWPDGSVRTPARDGRAPAPAAAACCWKAACRTSPSRTPSGGIRQLAYFDPHRAAGTGSSSASCCCGGPQPAQRQRLRRDGAGHRPIRRINDSPGPERGDQVLQVIGHRLRERDGRPHPAEPAGGGGPPRLKVARLRADEFGV